jgi:hypothetical protein
MPKGIKGSGISYQKYNCLHCGKENKCGRTKFNKFCDNTCQGKYKWKHETIPRIEAGLVPEGAPALKKYLLEEVVKETTISSKTQTPSFKAGGNKESNWENWSFK